MLVNHDKSTPDQDKVEIKGGSIMLIAITVIVVIAIMNGSDIISALKEHSDLKIVIERGSSVSQTAPVTEPMVVTEPPVVTTVTEPVTTPVVTTTVVTTPPPPKVHIAVCVGDNAKTTYDVVWLETAYDSQVEILGYNLYRNINETMYYHFKTTTGQELKFPVQECEIWVEE